MTTTTYTIEQATSAFEMTNGGTKTYEATFMLKDIDSDIKEIIKAKAILDVDNLIKWYAEAKMTESYEKYFTNKDAHIARKIYEATDSYIYKRDEKIYFTANDKAEAEKLARIFAKKIGKKLRWVYLATQKVGA